MKNKSKNIGREINNEHELESRRSSGNSITIKITNDNNVTMDDQSLENILNENFSILNEFERNNDIEVNFLLNCYSKCAKSHTLFENIRNIQNIFIFIFLK